MDFWDKDKRCLLGYRQGMPWVVSSVLNVYTRRYYSSGGGPSIVPLYMRQPITHALLTAHYVQQCLARQSRPRQGIPQALRTCSGQPAPSGDHHGTVPLSPSYSSFASACVSYRGGNAHLFSGGLLFAREDFCTRALDGSGQHLAVGSGRVGLSQVLAVRPDP